MARCIEGASQRLPPASQQQIEKVDEPERKRALRQTVSELQTRLDRMKSAPR